MPIIYTLEQCNWKVNDFPIPKAQPAEGEEPEIAKVLQLMDPISGILINIPFFDPEEAEALKPLQELSDRRAAAARLERFAAPPGVDLTKMPPGMGGNGQAG